MDLLSSSPCFSLGNAKLFTRSPEKSEDRDRPSFIEWRALPFPDLGEWYVQKFVSPPALVDGHKFVFRLFAVVTSFAPLRVQLHRMLPLRPRRTAHCGPSWARIAGFNRGARQRPLGNSHRLQPRQPAAGRSFRRQSCHGRQRLSLPRTSWHWNKGCSRALTPGARRTL